MSLYELTDAEALRAFELVERERIERLCKCDYDAGFTCRRCKVIRDAEWYDDFDRDPVDQVNRDMAYSKALRRREQARRP